jgi:two-component sensor histidine kinase
MAGEASSRQPNSKRQLGAFDVLLFICVALPLLLATAEIINDHRKVFEAAERSILITLDTIYGQAEKVFEFQALALGATEDRLSGQSNDELRTKVAEHHAALRKLRTYASEKLSIVIFDDAGHILVDSARPEPLADVDVSNRDYFRWHQEHPGPEPYVSSPFRSLTDGAVVFAITRRRSAPDGAFLGVAAVIVQQASLVNYWHQAAPSRRALVSLSRADGTILARQPVVDPEKHPRMLPHAPLAQAAHGGIERVVMRGTSPLDGVERLAAYRSLPQYQVNVSYGMPLSTVFAPWFRRAVAYASFAILTAIALSSLVLLARRRTQELSDLNANLEQRVKERTAEIEAGEVRLRLLAREVDHRAKNALAVVQATLQLTPKNDIASYTKAVEGRVSALSRAQTLLSEDHWRGASLHALLRAELAPFVSGGDGTSGTRAELEGLPVLLPPSAAQPLAMAVHELATNAVKHGPLSVSRGQVTITWQLVSKENAPADTLLLRWVESNGPVVSGPPHQRGFGSRVLTSVVRGQLGGKISLSWPPSGLICEIEMPLAHLQKRESPDPHEAA